MSIRSFKKEIHGFLQNKNLEEALKSIAHFQPKKLLKPLFAELCSCDELVKWHAVSAMGQTVATLADQDMEAARVVMRRFMWMLNDESGGIGWGAPEAIGEVTACHPVLAKEYGHMLVSYMREDGFFLELEALQRGLMWGVGRLAEVDSNLLIANKVTHYLKPYLQSQDVAVRGLAALAVGRLGIGEFLEELQNLQDDMSMIPVFRERKVTSCSVGALAREAIATIES